jgi:hypothetical protein
VIDILKNLLKSSILIFGLLIGQKANDYPIYYSGVDIQRRFMKFKDGYGSSTLMPGLPQSNIYGGIRFNRYFGLEVGYAETVTGRRQVTLHAGNMSAGMPIPEMLDQIVFVSTIKIQGPHIGMVGFYPVYKERLELFASIGIDFLKGTSTRRTVRVADIPINRTRTMVGRKQVPRLCVGVQYRLVDRLWIRGAVGVVATHKLNMRANDNVPGIYLPQIKPRSSKIVGIGLMWEF